MIKHEQTVVCNVETGFGTNVSNSATWKRLTCLNVPDGNKERVGSSALALGDELTHDDGMICGSTQTTTPPLTGSERRGVDDKLLSVGVVCGGGLQALDIGAVAQFCLGVAADDLKLLGFLEEQFLLFWCGLRSDGFCNIGQPIVSTSLFCREDAEPRNIDLCSPKAAGMSISSS